MADITNLSQLPPPPSGQKGMTLDQLVAPPAGQEGQTLEQILGQQTQPTQNNPVSQAGNDIMGNNPDQGAMFSVNQQQANNPGMRIKVAAKAGANVVPDFVRTTAGSPVAVAGQVGQVGSETAGLVKDSGGIMPAIKNYLSAVTDPQPYIDTLKSIIPSAAQKIVKGDFAGAAQDIANHPFQQIAPFLVALEVALENEKGVSKLGGPDVISKAAQPIVKPISDIGVKVGEGASRVASTVKNTIKPSLTPEEATGQIVQGKTRDISSAQRTFKNLTDTSKIKTNVDLSKAIDKQVIKPGLKLVDAEFAKDTTLHKIRDFSRTIGEGKNAVKMNYVSDAIKQLYDYYTKTGDAQGISDMKALAGKAKTIGLTYGDVNNLAREHGNSINAFNANGEASSGLSKQAAENTRRGLKSTARNGLGSSEAQATDMKIHEAIDTKNLIDKQLEKVNTSIQKNPKIGSIPKKFGVVVKAVGHPIDTLSRMTGVSGASTPFTPPELESRISGNLKIIRGE